MNEITTMAIDLAKNVFQLHGVDARGVCQQRRRVRRAQLLRVMARMPPCLVAMEACASAHYWGREFIEFGHRVKLIPPQYVKPFVRGNKTDGNDAEGICEAALRPRMPSVAVKTQEQQAVLAEHRIRQLLEDQRKQLGNQLRGLLAEFGIVIPLGSAVLSKGGSPTHYRNGRQVSASLGLVPKQYSSGDEPQLLGISKRGDTYLRTQLIHGARAVVRGIGGRSDPLSVWLQGLVARRGKNKAAVALANKTARRLWAIWRDEGAELAPIAQ